MTSHRWPSIAAFVLGTALLAGSGAHAAVDVPDGFVNEVIVQNLDQPTAFAFLPDGRVLFTQQRNGRVRMVVNGHIAATDPALTVNELVSGQYEQGLVGIAVDPAWPARPFIYVFYSRASQKCRIARYTGVGDVSDSSGENLTFIDRRLILDDIPDLTEYHQAGCLRFGPDGYLYAGLGDDDVNPCVAANPTTQRGEIQRLRVDLIPFGAGSDVPRALLIPPDNPISSSDSNARLVWAYGMRNPWRFNIDPVTGLLYMADVGEANFEEFNEVAAGDFMGWPWREGLLIMPRGSCPEPGGQGQMPFHAPIAIFPHGGDLTAVFAGGVYRPVAGGAFNWPSEYDGDTFYGEHYSGNFYRLKKTGSNWNPAPPVSGQPDNARWASGLISAVDFNVGPDGSLWWLRQFNDSFSSVTGSLQRIRNTLPPAAAPIDRSASHTLWSIPNPSSGRVELSFRLARPADVRLSVYDLAGRRVRGLHDGPALANETRIAWDGRDESGRTVAPGLYLARLEADGLVESARILRLK